MEINKYPDNTSYINNVLAGDDIFKVNSYEDLWHLNQFVDAYNNRLGFPPTITIPNLIDAQADRRFNNGESSGLKLVCIFLNGMNANFRIFHPHNAEVVESLIDNVEIIDNTQFINTILFSHKGLDLDTFDNTILMSSDAGGFKPLMSLCDKIDWKGETYSASKARTKDGMKQLIDRQDFEGKDVLIVDDISVYGGTFKGLSELLRERNCGKLYLGVSHMTVQNLGEKPVTEYFDKVFTTNSKFNNYWSGGDFADAAENYEQPSNLKVIKMF